jgi:predicted metal-dependent hydrolase
MTLPPRLSVAEALRFAETSKSWIASHLAKRPTAVALAHGAQILFQGTPHGVVATGGRRGVVCHVAGSAEIHVPGEEAHVPRRLNDWLKASAKQQLLAASQFYASAMQAKFKKITIRDQKSRWGSCSATGELSYSWRLILAPPEVLDYVAAHEVAHLLEMNHGPRFWRLVIGHCKGAKQARNWLRAHGHELHRYI